MKGNVGLECQTGANTDTVLVLERELVMSPALTRSATIVMVPPGLAYRVCSDHRIGIRLSHVHQSALNFHNLCSSCLRVVNNLEGVGANCLLH